jgi:nitroimidazol reductase NimA-like FMN-containing flavoprotein (pyridoxamine 5'-phosphate oxidase superfamily)
MTEEETEQILCSGTSGVLALSGDDDYPYAVPISYVYDQKNRCLYFHGAGSGHKMDAIRRSDRASFCVIDQDQIVPERFTAYFRSVIAFGRIRIINDEKEKKEAIEKLAVKYSPDEPDEKREAEIMHTWKALCILRMDIEHMTGKQSIELVNQKK